MVATVVTALHISVNKLAINSKRNGKFPGDKLATAQHLRQCHRDRL